MLSKKCCCIVRDVIRSKISTSLMHAHRRTFALIFETEGATCNLFFFFALEIGIGTIIEDA